MKFTAKPIHIGKILFAGACLAFSFLAFSPILASAAVSKHVPVQCTISREATYNPSDCLAREGRDEGSHYWILQRKGDKPFFGDVSYIYVTEVDAETAVISQVTTSGSGEITDWGNAKREGNCWIGEDFRVCFDVDKITSETGKKKADKQAFSAKEREKMGVFLSNFTEVGMFDFDAETVLSTPDSMVHFAIRHNYINAYKRTITDCKTKNCPFGSLAMDAKHVREALLRYFGTCPSKLPTVENEEHMYHFDGRTYHFEGADGEQTWYARVDSAETLPNGNIRMNGVFYNAEDKAEVQGKFTAFAKPHTWNNKATWAIISLKAHD